MRAEHLADTSSKRYRTAFSAIPVGLFMLAAFMPEYVRAQELDSFAILAGSTVTNTGPTTINGNIGLSPGTAFTGSGSVTLTGTRYIGDAVASRAQADLTTLYDILAGRPTSSGGNLTGQDLGGQTLQPGVYNFDSSAGLAAGQTLTLDGNGNPDAIFIFNIGTSLTTLSGSRIVLQNGAQGGNVFFRVGSSATLGTSTTFVGQIVALTAITLQTAATINCGAALARNAAVTLDTNTIGVCVLDNGSFEEALDPDDEGTPPTETAGEIADLLDSFASDGGTLPAGFAILAASLTPEELRLALAQLSGEVATGVAPSNRRTMISFLDLVTSRASARTTSPLGSPAAQERGTVSALGYAPVPLERPEFAAFDQQFQSPPAWDVWVAGFGNYGVTEGDEALGSRERVERDFGIVAGVDFFLNADTTIGFAVGKARSSFSLADDGGSGTSDILQAGIHFRTELDAAYVAAALGYGYSNVSTERTVTIAGLDRFGAEFDAHTFAADLEAGYQIGLFTPYVGINAQSFNAPAYSETVLAGVPTYGLDYQDQHDIAVGTELGVRLDYGTETEFGRVDVDASVAWRHALISDDDIRAGFQAIPGSQFSVQGANADADSVAVNLGVQLSFDNGVGLGAQLGGDFSANATNYGGSLKLSYAW